MYYYRTTDLNCVEMLTVALIEQSDGEKSETQEHSASSKDSFSPEMLYQVKPFQIPTSYDAPDLSCTHPVHNHYDETQAGSGSHHPQALSTL